jgi:hypothetical protein
MVLLSDGYDNKGCDPANPAKPSALDAVVALPAGLPVYSCAMGPSSDQALLEQIATATSGRYYFMPTIDDLFEIYNYIRGQVTGDSIIANEAAVASSSRVAAFVDALATEATFTVAWADVGLRYVPRPPKRSELTVQLRDPRGRLLNANSSFIRRTVGAGYVAFEVQEPAAGQWYIEVTTGGDSHVRYTAGAFVRSRLTLSAWVAPKAPKAGNPLTISAQVLDGTRVISGHRTSASISGPALGIDKLLDRYKSRLADIRVPKMDGDQLPPDVAKLNVLRSQLLQQGQPDIFARAKATTIGLKLPATRPPTGPIGRPVLVAAWSAVLAAEIELAREGEYERVGAAAAVPLAAGAVAGVGVPGGALGEREAGENDPSRAPAPAPTAVFTATQQKGSYNVVVTASGTSAASRTRFVRKQLVSAYLR